MNHMQTDNKKKKKKTMDFTLIFLSLNSFLNIISPVFHLKRNLAAQGVIAIFQCQSDRHIMNEVTVEGHSLISLLSQTLCFTGQCGTLLQLPRPLCGWADKNWDIRMLHFPTALCVSALSDSFC